MANFPCDWFYDPDAPNHGQNWPFYPNGTFHPSPSLQNLHHPNNVPPVNNHSFDPQLYPNNLAPTFPETLHDTIQDILNPFFQDNFNPIFPHNLYDHLDQDFTRFNLSTPPHQPRVNNSSIYSHYPNMDLERRDIQSTVRRNMSLQPPSPGNTSNDSNVVFPNYNEPRNNIYNEERSWIPSPARIPYNQNISITSGSRLGSENRSVLMSCLHNNNSDNMVRSPSSRQRMNNGCLEELSGRILWVAKEQRGCLFLVKKLEEGKVEAVDMVFLEVKDHIFELMVDQFGSYVIQKLVEVCSHGQINHILISIISDYEKVLHVCFNMYGTRAMQTLLENLTTQDPFSLVVSVLKCVTVTLSKNKYGHHVIEQCLKLFSPEDMKPVVNVVADHCLDIAIDKSGCFLLQKSLEHAQGELRERLLAQIISNVCILSHNAYGNYVVQYILGMGIPRVKEDIQTELKGSFVNLSMNRYSSNVVEKCLKEASKNQSARIIHELMDTPHFVDLLTHAYGHYVVQSALDVSQGDLGLKLVRHVKNHYKSIHNHTYGKKVLLKSKGTKERILQQQS